MRRMLFSEEIQKMPKETFDVVVIGEGLAGLYGVLHLNPDFRVAILTKSANESSSYLSQGGIAAVINPEDSEGSHYRDTLTAGAGLCDKDAVRLLVREGPSEIEKLLNWEVSFDKQANGQLQTTLEGGHSVRRIVHCGGDETGKEIVDRLRQIVKESENITNYTDACFADIVTREGKVTGVVVLRGGRLCYWEAPKVMLCTGGIGALYPYSTNPRLATGDGIAAAKRAGARLKMMEFVQFHPTTFYSETGESSGRCFLISEAVRGEGGILRNEKGEAFMKDRHPLADLAPRDIVTREITRELAGSSKPYVYLDITSRSESFLEKRFPSIYQYCLEHGINISKDFIPVRPVQHYFMGGVETDMHGKTCVEGLYACGEVACTGVHGANRLASNSLLECLVFSRRAAEDINRTFEKVTAVETDFCEAPNETASSAALKEIHDEIQGIMYKSAGIIRNAHNMKKGIARMEEILKSLYEKAVYSEEYIEVVNMAEVGLEVLRAAEKNHINAGAHYREDV